MRCQSGNVIGDRDADLERQCGAPSVDQQHRGLAAGHGALSAAAYRFDLPPKGQAIDRSDFGCGQPVELADPGIDLRHGRPR